MRNYAQHQNSQFRATEGGGLLLRAWSYWEHRRGLKQLRELDDHLLRDIGVSRGEVRR